MKILAHLATASCLLFIFSTSVQAAGKSAYQETYNIGLIAGSIDGDTNFGSVDATGLVLSARNKKAVLEYVNMSSGEGNLLTAGDTWETNISGFYLALIGEGQPYVKFKVGKVKQELVQTISGTLSSETTSVTSYGIGMGYKMGTRIMLEAELTSLDNDMTLLTLSVLF